MMLFIGIIVGVKAQTSQLATLMHDGQMSIFYGASGLKDAHAAAVDGDVITLSAGQFTAVNLTKAITLRGAGMGLTEKESFSAPTILSGNFYIRLAEDNQNTLQIEGIQHNQTLYLDIVNNVVFSKCVFNQIKKSEQKEIVYNVKLMHCDVRGEFHPYSPSKLSVTALNSRFYYVNTESSAHYTFQNCIVSPTDVNKAYPATGQTAMFSNSSLTNCIIINNKIGQKGYVSASSTAFYCIWYGESSDQPFTANNYNGTNRKYNGEKLFKDGTFYELVDEVKAFATSDGTQPGIYGGSLPFDDTTSVPQITKFSVSPKTSADGKLSIDIELTNAD